MKSEKKRSKKSLAIVLTAIMIVSVCAVIPAMGNGEQPTVMRTIEESTVSPGQDFWVAVEFTEPAPRDIDSATIADKIQDLGDWDVKILVVTPYEQFRWTTNNATLVTWGDINTIEEGDDVVVIYQLTVPTDAEERDYDFFGRFLTDIWGGIVITGDNHVTVEVPDEEPPVISDVASSSITTNSATITWNTDENSDSLVKYGTASGVYTEQKYNAADVTAHSIGLTVLSPDTTYYYVVNSTDPSDNSAESAEYSFTTEAVPDEEPPAAISNLATSNPTSNSITLTWTAPGDDGNTGTATTYDIRYLEGTTQITEDNWDSATECDGEPAPQVAGSSETFTVTVLLSETTYYFAIKTADEVPLWSSVSNSPSGTTTEASQQYDIALVEGWNMFGVPLNVSDWTLAAVLSSIDEKYDYISYYNATSEVMEYYDPLDPDGSTLKTLEPGAGYMIEMSEDATASFEGTKLMGLERSLKTDWNMFSVPYGVVDKTLPTVLSSIDEKYDYISYYNAISEVMEYYDPLDPDGSTLNTLEPGAGYLIEMSEDAVFIPDMGS